MSFAKLYETVQSIDGHISVRRLRDEAIRLSSITTVKEQWTGIIEPQTMRGFYIEGPMGPPVPLAENEALIVLPRGLDRASRRIVYAKELMHVFDTPEEKTDTPEKFDAQIERLADPQATITEQSRAEGKALWRAVSLFCPEQRRVEFQKAFDAREVSMEVIAAALRLPPQFARILFRPDYLQVLENLKRT